MEYEKIKEQFDEVIKYSQDIPDPKTDQIFRNWQSNKQRFIDTFGGKLIYEVPEEVSFHLSAEARMDKINEIIEIARNRYGLFDLGRFINFNKDNFFDGLTTEDFCYDRSVSDAYIKAGTKIIKAFKYFIQDKEVLNQMQSAASRIIQEDKITGQLCFSVHPLDFLSLSENTHKWRSCHALDGEFRAGNLSYMQDAITCICYIKSKEDTKLPNFPESVPWNNKKWRMLMYMNNNYYYVFAGRPYPFEIPGAREVVAEQWNKLSGSTWGSWRHEYINEYLDPVSGENWDLDHDYIYIAGKLQPLDEVVPDYPGAQHYNDLLYSSCYRAYYNYDRKDRDLNPWQHPLFDVDYEYPWRQTGIMTIGYAARCLHCGVEHIERGGDSMLCYRCERELNANRLYCSYCERYIRPGEDYFYIHDNIACRNCWEESSCECVKCGMLDMEGYMTFSQKMQGLICEICYNEEEEE